MVWLIGAILALSGSYSISAEEIFRVASESWLPFIGKELKHDGVLSHIVTEAFAHENVKVEFTYFSSGARVLRVVKKGEWNATAGWTGSKEREKDYYFSDNLMDEKMVFFYNKDVPFHWENWDDLKALSVGATKGYYYGEQFDLHAKNNKLQIEWVRSDDLNFKKLIKRRINIFPMNLDVGMYVLRSKFTAKEIEPIDYHSKPLDQGPLVMLFSKKIAKNVEFVKKFNKGLNHLKEMGKYDQYFENSRQGGYVK